MAARWRLICDSRVVFCRLNSLLLKVLLTVHGSRAVSNQRVHQRQLGRERRLFEGAVKLSGRLVRDGESAARPT